MEVGDTEIEIVFLAENDTVGRFSLARHTLSNTERVKFTCK